MIFQKPKLKYRTEKMQKFFIKEKRPHGNIPQGLIISQQRRYTLPASLLDAPAG